MDRGEAVQWHVKGLFLCQCGRLGRRNRTASYTTCHTPTCSESALPTSPGLNPADTTPCPSPCSNLQLSTYRGTHEGGSVGARGGYVRSGLFPLSFGGECSCVILLCIPAGVLLSCAFQQRCPYEDGEKNRVHKRLLRCPVTRMTCRQPAPEYLSAYEWDVSRRVMAQSGGAGAGRSPVSGCCGRHTVGVVMTTNELPSAASSAYAASA